VRFRASPLNERLEPGAQAGYAARSKDLSGPRLGQYCVICLSADLADREFSAAGGSFDVELLLEAILAFEDKDALVREITAVPGPAGVFAADAAAQIGRRALDDLLAANGSRSRAGLETRAEARAGRGRA